MIKLFLVISEALLEECFKKPKIKFWKVLEFQGKHDDNKKNTCGFESLKCPPLVNEIKSFENELLLMVKNIESKNAKNEFQEKLKEDINEIKTIGKMFVAADNKTYI